MLNDFFAEFKNVPNDQKKEFGQAINELKTITQEKVNALKKASNLQEEQHSQLGDLTRPGEPINIGSRHPISIVKNQIIDIFSRIGFNVSEGPEIEDDWHNFTALNLPEHHPARDMQDTFFVQTDPDILLRTHTSSVQVRYMENNKPPIRTISPGRVYRNEAISARSHCFFHQVEGLYIDKNVSFEINIFNNEAVIFNEQKQFELESEEADKETEKHKFYLVFDFAFFSRYFNSFTNSSISLKVL